MPIDLAKLTDEKKKEMLRLARFIDDHQKATIDELDELDDKVELLNYKIETLSKEAKEAILIAEETQKMDGKPGYTPVKGVDYEDGKDYQITERDIESIAKVASKRIAIPVVEKIIEKTEVIREQPIITNQVVKEIVTDFDTSIIDDKIKALENRIEELKNQGGRRDVISGRIGIQALNNNVKVGARVNDINFGTGLTVAQVNGGVTVTSTGGGSFSILTATGTVNSINTVFTFSTAPSVIVVDGGRSMRATSSNGNINWTGTTTVTLQIAPTKDIYGY
jgi:hypothetical protein